MLTVTWNPILWNTNFSFSVSVQRCKLWCSKPYMAISCTLFLSFLVLSPPLCIFSLCLRISYPVSLSPRTIPGFLRWRKQEWLMWLLAVAFFCVSFLFSHFLYNTRRDNILALMTLFLYQVGKRQKPFLLMHMGGVCVCMCTFAYVWHTTQLKMRYGQADGSELAGSLLLCMEEYSKQ